MKNKEMDRVFTKLELEEIPCKHHRRGMLVIDGVKILSVFHSFGNKEIPRFVVDKIAKSMGLKKQELQKMGKCKISKEEYIEIIRGRGWI